MLSLPSWIAVTLSPETSSFSTTVRHFAVCVRHVTFAPLPAVIAMAHPAAILAVGAAEHRANTCDGTSGIPGLTSRYNDRTNHNNWNWDTFNQLRSRKFLMIKKDMI